MADIFKVFLRLNGRRPGKIISKAINKGIANTGIYIHDISRYANGGTGIQKIVEKRTTRKPEMRTTRLIVDWQRNGDEGALAFPKVFEISKDKDTGELSIFMEHLDGAGIFPDCAMDTHLADAIVSAVLSVNGLNIVGETIEEQRGSTAGEILAQWGNAVRREAADIKSRDAIEKIVHDASNELAAQPVLMSHNDLQWANMAVDGATKVVRFLDFGTMKGNIAGAELHHFYRDAVTDRDRAAFFDLLVARYSETAKFDERKIAIASKYYALVRSCSRMNRWRSGREKGAAGKPKFTKERFVIEAVASDLLAMLSARAG